MAKGAAAIAVAVISVAVAWGLIKPRSDPPFTDPITRIELTVPLREGRALQDFLVQFAAVEGFEFHTPAGDTMTPIEAGGTFLATLYRGEEDPHLAVMGRMYRPNQFSIFVYGDPKDLALEGVVSRLNAGLAARWPDTGRYPGR